MNLITEKPVRGHHSPHETATPSTPAAIAGILCDVADRLAGCPSLRPAPEVNALFGRLVQTVVDAPDDVAAEVLADSSIRDRMSRFRDLSARGEGELERAWAERICAAADPSSELARFPYLDNYRRLVRMETGVLASALRGSLRSVAVVGSGPMPLSALFLATPDVVVDGFDRDPQAVAASRRIVELTGVQGMRFHHADAADADLSGYQVVVLAALVGSTPQEKAAIIARMRSTMTADTILLVRSARGLRSLLYPPIAPAALPGFEVLNVVHPVNDIINSVVVARPAQDG